MKLRSVCNGEKYNVESRRIRDEILTLVESPVKDGKLKGYFDLMKEKRHRFFLMAIIDTLSLRNEDAVAKLIDVLYELARDPKRDVTDLLWGKADKP